MRTLLVILACFTVTCVGAVAMSWGVGPHRVLLNEIDTVLDDDSNLVEVERNYSPYCFIGSCPKVAARSEVQLGPSEASSAIRVALLRRGYSPGDGDPVWSEYSRKGQILRFRVEAGNRGYSSLFWEIGRGLVGS